MTVISVSAATIGLRLLLLQIRHLTLQISKLQREELEARKQEIKKELSSKQLERLEHNLKSRIPFRLPPWEDVAKDSDIERNLAQTIIEPTLDEIIRFGGNIGDIQDHRLKKASKSVSGQGNHNWSINELGVVALLIGVIFIFPPEIQALIVVLFLIALLAYLAWLFVHYFSLSAFVHGLEDFGPLIILAGACILLLYYAIRGLAVDPSLGQFRLSTLMVLNERVVAWLRNARTRLRVAKHAIALCSLPLFVHAAWLAIPFFLDSVAWWQALLLAAVMAYCLTFLVVMMLKRLVWAKR